MKSLKLVPNSVIIYKSLLLFGIIPILLKSKIELFLIINKFHNSFFDILFYYLSYFGHFTFFVLTYLIIFLSKVKNRYMIAFGFGMVLTTIIIQSLKMFFFKDILRPAYLTLDFDLHILDKVILKQFSSFPSGHSAVIFAIVCFLSMHFNTKILTSLVLFILASLVAYSRIYLAQHFYTDVYFGALIGGTSTLIMYKFIGSINFFRDFFDASSFDILIKNLNL